jgi:hypothetical protein
MPPKLRKTDLDPEQSLIWEKILILAQRVDKLEYTTQDFRDEFKSFAEKDFTELKTSVTTSVRDEAYRKHDWLKVGLTIVIAILLSGFLIWFSLISKVNTLEVLVHKEMQWTPHFATKDHVQNVVNESLEKMRKELQDHINRTTQITPSGVSDDKKPAEAVK